MQKLVITLIVFVVAIFIGLTFFKPQSPQEDQMVMTTAESSGVQEPLTFMPMTPEVAKDLIGQEGVYLLDVRTLEEYASGHIEGSILLPVDDLAQGIADVVANKDDMVIIYCRSGNRSKRAAKTMIDLGYTNVHDLGGIMTWPYEIVK